MYLEIPPTLASGVLHDARQKPLLSMKLNSRLLIPAAVAAAFFHPLPAATVDQHKDFAASNEGELYSGTEMRDFVGSDFFTADFQPFDSSLGTLQSLTFKFTMSALLTATAGDETGSGVASGGFGGPFTIGGTTFASTGGGYGFGAMSGESFEVAFGTPAFETTLPNDDTLNPDIKAAITGEEPIAVSFNTGVTLNYSNVNDLAADLTAKITLIYTYTTPDGGTASIKITKVLRNKEAENVTIEWTSTSGKTYAVEASGQLGGWAVIDASVSAGAGATTTFIEEDIPATVERRFYRIRENE